MDKKEALDFWQKHGPAAPSKGWFDRLIYTHDELGPYIVCHICDYTSGGAIVEIGTGTLDCNTLKYTEGLYIVNCKERVLSSLLTLQSMIQSGIPLRSELNEYWEYLELDNFLAEFCKKYQ